MKFGKGDLLKYPFMEDAGQYLKSMNIPMDDLANSETFKPLAEMAFERINNAVKNQKSVEKDYFGERDVQNAIFAFGISMFVLKLINIPYFTRKFALTEAIRSEKYLMSDVKESPEIVDHMIKTMFKTELKRDGNTILMPVSSYLMHSSQFHELEWKLVNRVVHAGFVHLSIREAIRLFRRDLQAFIVKAIEKANVLGMYNTKGVCRYKNFEEYVKAMKVYAKEFNFVSTYNSTDIPPCIEDAMKTLEESQNLSHSGRFMLASFLLSRGWDAGEVAELFKSAPDYDYRVTTYQISKIGQGGYKCPGCSKLVSQGLCRKTAECGTIINPLQFKRSKK